MKIEDVLNVLDFAVCVCFYTEKTYLRIRPQLEAADKRPFREKFHLLGLTMLRER